MMALHDNTKSSPLETSQADETVTTDRKQTYRLYPSLPDIDRYDVCVPDYSTCTSPGKHRTAAGSRPDSVLGDTQSEALAASSDVRMKAHILMLEEQRQELLSINEKWAKEYKTMKQYYKEKVRELNTSLQHDHSHFEEEMCEEGEKNIILYRRVKDEQSIRTGERDVSSELLNAEKNVKELRAQNSTLNRRWQHQHEEIRRLNKALEEALHPPGGSSESLQDIWKHQAEIYKEDFLKERRDREKLKGKYLELENKFRKVHSELRVLKPQVIKARPPQPIPECTCTKQAKCPNWEVRPVNQHHKQLQGRYTFD